MRALLLGLLLLTALVPTGSAAETKSCVIVPHGAPAGVTTNGCTVSGIVTSELRATVTVMAGNVDAILLSMVGPGGARQDFVCTATVSSAQCFFPIRTTGAPGAWSVTARGVTSDPAGIFLGGFDSYAQLDATFI